MPIVTGPVSLGSYGGPQFLTAGGRVICKFGNGTRPVVGGAVAWYDLNDGTNWNLTDLDLSAAAVLQLTPQAWRAKGVYLGYDRSGKTVTLTEYYSEATFPLGYAISQLTQIQDQFLTFDGVTQVPATLASWQPVMRTKYAPYLWTLGLTFNCRAPYWSDITPTTPAATAISGSAAGSATTFSITYPGTVWAQPTWTLTVPNTNTAAISQLVLKSNYSSEALTVTVPLAASTAWTVTIDSANYTVTDQNGTAYAFTGSFPNLYGPMNTANSITATLTTVSGSTTGVTLGPSYSSRWEM